MIVTSLNQIINKVFFLFFIVLFLNFHFSLGMLNILFAVIAKSHLCTILILSDRVMGNLTVNTTIIRSLETPVHIVQK